MRQEQETLFNASSVLINKKGKTKEKLNRLDLAN